MVRSSVRPASSEPLKACFDAWCTRINLRTHLEKERLDLDSPRARDVLDDLLDLGGDGLPVREEVLEVASSDDVTESSLSTLDESLTDVGDTEGGL